MAFHGMLWHGLILRAISHNLSWPFGRLWFSLLVSLAVIVRILAAKDHDGVCATNIMGSITHGKGAKYTVAPISCTSENVHDLQQLE